MPSPPGWPDGTAVPCSPSRADQRTRPGRLHQRTGAAGDGRHRLLPRRAQSAHRPLPLLYGADCAVLLAAIPALRDTTSRAGLLFVDAHEDATPMERCDTGEAASMEIAPMLGLTGTHTPEPLRSRLPALDRDTIVMLGQRDHLYRRQIGVPTIGPGSAAPSQGVAG